MRTKTLNQHFSTLQRILITAFVFLLILSCGQQPEKDEDAAVRPVSNVNHPEWSISANIYEVNVRQYTPEGTFEAFAQHLERLRDMGTDILWFMPLQPIGEEERKGALGSYYSIRDYTATNPEFGTMAEFKQLVDQAHEMGMYVILDWVANHTAWDHYWTIGNPEFYETDDDGNFFPPVDDWSDVIQLDYGNEELWDAMIEEMSFWVREIGIDGFRCDVAYMVPVEFWNRARQELEQIRPVFMLAEAETPELHEHAFNAGYGWSLHHMMNSVAQGELDVSAIDEYFFEDDAGGFPYGSYKMYFITNHDENSWAGTEFDRMGDGVEAFAVFTVTIPGTVLVYSGQEAGFNRMLEFFEKDQIDWGDYKYHDFYKKLLGLKSNNKALRNGDFGGEMIRVNTDQDEKVFSFVRENEGHKVFTVLNLSAENLEVSFSGSEFTGDYTELFSEESVILNEGLELTLAPWDYHVYYRE